MADDDLEEKKKRWKIRQLRTQTWWTRVQILGFIAGGLLWLAKYLGLV